MSWQRILVEEGAVLRVTMNRPEKRNAIDGLLIAELKQVFESEAARDAKVIALAGAGKDFCSGADLSGLREVRDAGVIANMDDARRMADLFRLMRRHPRPVVALVKGRALAGGCGLATACDMILAAESSQFGYPEVNIGFVPAMVMAILRRSVSEKRAFEIVTMGVPMSASVACEAGLVNHVYPDAEFDEKANGFILQLASKPVSAVELCKRLLYHMDGVSYDTALEAGVHMNGIARMTDECKAGIDRFLAR